MSWDSFVEELSNSECALVYPGSNLVVGRGNLNPEIVFVGEAPGAEEDRLQKPFVGRSGKLLDKWIEFLGLEDEFYICNVMKSRPANNRDPTPDEVTLCSPWLEKQLELLQPKVVVAVGRFAMNFFFPKMKGILKNSGKLINGKYYVVPHPSYFLRNGGSGWEPYLQELKYFLGGESVEVQQKLV